MIFLAIYFRSLGLIPLTMNSTSTGIWAAIVKIWLLSLLLVVSLTDASPAVYYDNEEVIIILLYCITYSILKIVQCSESILTCAKKSHFLNQEYPT
jgi:hypothetical protein